jgi:hypothetical protein
MHPDLQKYLDGELVRSALPPEAEAELRMWERLEGDMAARRAHRAPAHLQADVMRAIADLDMASPALSAAAVPDREAAPRAAGRPQRSRRLAHRAWQWLITPRPLQVRPLAPLAAAAVLAAVMITQATPPAEPNATALPSGEAPVIYVQFALTAEGARTVSVAGDFNDWSVDAGTLRDVDGSGVWRGLIAVQPGVHKYMFVVDGEEWVTDPTAERYIDDGFGMRNALLAVVAPAEVL